MSFIINPYRYGAGGTPGSGTTWNPADATAGWTLSNGNSRATVASNARSIRCTRGTASGEFLYCEIPLINIGIAPFIDNAYIGLCLGSQSINSIGSPYWLMALDGSVVTAGGTGSGGGGAVASGGYMMFAKNYNTKRLYVGYNGAWRNSGNPTAGTGYVYEFTTAASFKIVIQTDGSNGTDTKVLDFNDGTLYQGTMPGVCTKW